MGCGHEHFEDDGPPGAQRRTQTIWTPTIPQGFCLDADDCVLCRVQLGWCSCTSCFCKLMGARVGFAKPIGTHVSRYCCHQAEGTHGVHVGVSEGGWLTAWGPCNTRKTKQTQTSRRRTHRTCQRTFSQLPGRIHQHPVFGFGVDGSPIGSDVVLIGSDASPRAHFGDV